MDTDITARLEKVCWLDLSPANIDLLGSISGKVRLKHFLIEAEWLVSASLIRLWIGEGAGTPAAILAKMREEVEKRRDAIASVRSRSRRGSLGDILPEEDTSE